MKKLIFLSLLSLFVAACSQERVAEKSTNVDSNPKLSAHVISGITLENFDTSIRPQDDLFRYVNGTWLKNTKIPADKSNYGSFTALADKAREDMQVIIESSAAQKNAKLGSEAQKVGDLYNSFMNTAKLEELKLAPLNNEIKKINAISDKKALAAYFAEALRIGSDAPFSFYINNDSKQPNQYITYFVHTGLGLPDRDYYFKEDEKSQDIRKQYVAHINNMFTLAGWNEPKVSARKIMALETKIANAHWTRVERRNRDKTYNNYAKKNIKALAESFDWSVYLKAAGINNETNFVFRTPSFYEEFNVIFTETLLADWKVYQRWQLLNSYAGKLNASFDNEHFAFYSKTLQGTEQQEARWKRAVSAVNGLLGEMVGKVYVEKHFKPEAKARMSSLVENLRVAYAQSIQQLDWMGNETKKQALEKLRKFKPKIGYPDKWKDYSALTIQGDELVGNFIRASIVNHNRDINKLGKPIDKDEWFMTPQTVNAYYNPNMNEIVFPAAILQPPFFNMAADDAVNYGGIGAVIGHEMGHGFDDQGAKSDGDGVLRNWWTEQDLAEFKKRTGKLVSQYSDFEVLPGEFLNGEFTQGENIGDLGGMTIAYRAYQLSLQGKEARELDGFSGSERFFIGWAQVWARKYRDENLRQRIATDPHSPSEFRSNGIVRNMPEFIKIFKVMPGDGLYLPEEERVKIW